MRPLRAFFVSSIPPHPLQRRLFRLLLGIGIGASLVTTMSILGADAVSMRRINMRLMTETAASIAHNAAPLVWRADRDALTHYASSFDNYSAAQLLCFYSRDNRLLAGWQRGDGPLACPTFLLREAVEGDFTHAHITRVIRVGEQYYGTLRFDATLSSLQGLVSRAASVLLMLCVISYVGCRLASRLMARLIAAPLAALQARTECLAQGDSSLCPLPPPSGIAEIDRLMEAVRVLQYYFVHAMVPLEVFEAERARQHALLSAVLTEAARRAAPGTALPALLDDYQLLSQGGAPVRSLPMLVHLPSLLAAAKASALQLASSAKDVHVTLSLQPGAPEEWLAPPILLEALIRHLLLLALGRVKSGYVVLRLDCHEVQGGAHHMSLRLSDSGSLPSARELRLLMPPTQGETCIPATPEELAWGMAGDIFMRLGGRWHNVANSAGEEFFLQGEMTLSAPPQAPIPPSAVMPIVIVVEEEPDAQTPLRRLLASAGCRAFIVPHHTDALEWSACLPCSAVMLSAEQPTWHDTRRRLKSRTALFSLGELPVWLTLPLRAKPFETHSMELDAALLTPFQLYQIKPLCVRLKAVDLAFYYSTDEELRRDFSPVMLACLPDLNLGLASQLALLARLTDQAHASLANAKAGASAAHAVKSAALTLGYFRLAALMAEIEQEYVMPKPGFHAANWEIITACLRDAEKALNPAQGEGFSAFSAGGEQSPIRLWRGGLLS